MSEPINCWVSHAAKLAFERPKAALPRTLNPLGEVRDKLHALLDRPGSKRPNWEKLAELIALARVALEQKTAAGRLVEVLVGEMEARP